MLDLFTRTKPGMEAAVVGRLLRLFVRLEPCQSRIKLCIVHEDASLLVKHEAEVWSVLDCVMLACPLRMRGYVVGGGLLQMCPTPISMLCF